MAAFLVIVPMKLNFASCVKGSLSGFWSYIPYIKKIPRPVVILPSYHKSAF